MGNRAELIYRRGFSMIMVMMILTVIGIGLGTFMTLHSFRAKQIGSAWDKTVALEAAKSSFTLLESAMRRRLWEAPPDSKCMKLLTFGLTATTPESVELTLNATLDPASGMLRMISQAKYRNLTVQFQKTAKISDASDFLVASSATTESVVSQDIREVKAVGLIGNDRRIYFEGPVLFSSQMLRDPPATSCGVPTPISLPREISVVMQAERITMLGGMGYQTFQYNPPDPADPMAACVAPYTAPHNYAFQKGAGGAVIVADPEYAEAIRSEVDSPGSSPKCPSNAPGCYPSKSNLVKSFYPRALFCGSGPPYVTKNATDSGCFIDPDRWFSFQYDSYAHSGTWVDMTCVSDLDEPPSTRRRCSFSTDFPKGFNSWRTGASLDGVLFTGDGSPMELPKLDWDNMEALEEDADACGHVVTASSGTNDGSYTDCDLSDSKLIKAYINSPSTDPCGKVYTLDPDTVTSRFSNFTASTYTDATKRDNFLRRVVYSKVPTRLTQKSDKGIFTSLPTDARPNLPIWFVNELDWYLQPYQPNLSRVTPTETKLRQLYFNQDSNTTRNTTPINIVMLSPEQVVILSPRHDPWTFAEMQSRLPVVGTRIKPVYHIFTDWEHQENDGFIYGFREINISNMLLVSNAAAASYESGFFLRGLWSAPASTYNSDNIYPSCMMDKPGDSAGRVVNDDAPPPYGNPWVPEKSTSYFYEQSSAKKVGRYQSPFVFNAQADKHGFNSHLFFKGTRLVASFDNTIPSGKRDLSTPLRTRVDGQVVDVSDRRIVMSRPNLIAAGFATVPAQPAAAPCQPISGSSDGIARNGIPMNFMAYFNRGAATFLHSAPDDTFSNVGALIAQDLPAIQVSD